MQHDVPILTPELGINVNDKHQAFTEQILSGAKTIETRNASTLHPYIGKKMGLVRTGKGKAMLVGYVTIGEPKLYTAQSSFDKDFDSHLVGKDSPFHISKSKKGSKWGYTLSDVEKVEPRLLKDGTGVAPNPRVARKLQNAASPVRYASAQDNAPSSTLPSDKPASTGFGSTKDWVTKNDPHHSFMNERRQILPWRYTPQDLKSNLFGPVRHRSHDDAQSSAVHFIAGHSAQMSPIDTLGIAGHHEIRPLISVLGLRPRSDEDNYRRYPYEESSYMPMSLVPYNRSGFAESGFASVVGDNARLMNRKVLEHLGVQYKPLRDSNRDIRELFNPMFKDRQAAERIAKAVGGYVHTVHIDPSTLRGKFPRVGRPSGEMGGMTLIDQRKSGDAPRDLSQSVATLAKHPDYGEYIVTHNPSRLTKEGSFFHRTSHFAGSLARAERARFDHFGSTPEQIRRRLLISPVEDSHIRPLISQYWQNLIDLHSEFHEDPYHHSDKTDYNLPRVLSADGLGADHTPPTTYLIYSMGDDARHLYAMALADHNEHAPRIILADLFDEHGHEGAANFMRASVPHQASGQVKLAKDPSAKPSVARSEIAPETQQPAQPAALQRGDPIKVRPAGERGQIYNATYGRPLTNEEFDDYAGVGIGSSEHERGGMHAVYKAGEEGSSPTWVHISNINPSATPRVSAPPVAPERRSFSEPHDLRAGDVIHIYDSRGNKLTTPHLSADGGGKHGFELVSPIKSDPEFMHAAHVIPLGPNNPQRVPVHVATRNRSFSLLNVAPSASAQSAQSNRQRVNVGDYVHLHHPSGHRVDNALYTLDAIEPHQYTISMVGEHLNDNQRGIEIPKSDATLRPAPPPEADRLAAEQDPHAFKSWPSAPVRGQPVRHRDIDGNWRRATYHGTTGDVFSDGRIAHRLDVRDADGVVQRGVMTTPDRIKPIPSVHPASVTLSNVLDAEGANADSLPFSSLRDHSPGDRVWARPSGSGLWNDAKMATLVSRDISKAGTPEEFAVRFDDANDPVNVGANNLVRSANQSRPYFDAFEGSPVSVIDRANGKVYHGTHVTKFVIPSEEFTHLQGHESVSSIRNMTGMDNISESWLGREANEGMRDTNINNGYSESPVHIVKIWEPGASTPLNIAVEQEDVLPRFHPARPGEQMAITSPGHDPRSRHSATRPDQDPNIIYNELDEEFRTGDDVEIRGMPARIYFVNGKAGRAFVSYPDRRTTGSFRILPNDYGSGFQVGISSALRHRQPSAQPASSSGASGAQNPAKVSADAPPITMPLERMIWNQVNSTSSGQMFPPDHQKLAHRLRSSFEALFGQKVDDQTIMDTLRVPRSFPGADPNHPAFSPENIHLDVSIHNDGSITSHSKSKLPNYHFYATTEVGSDSIQNASQSHSGESGTKTKYISTPHILQNQANAAHRLGIDKLDVNAAFSNPVRENGGYTGGLVWPTYGYTKRLFAAYSGSDRAEAVAITRRNNPDLHAKGDSELTLNHLLDSKEGMDWYTHGDPYHAGGTYYPHVASGSMVFHTHPDSASHRILGRKTGRLEKNAASRNKPV